MSASANAFRSLISRGMLEVLGSSLLFAAAACSFFVCVYVQTNSGVCAVTATTVTIRQNTTNVWTKPNVRVFRALVCGVIHIQMLLFMHCLRRWMCGLLLHFRSGLNAAQLQV
jgi:hypothetical protein